MTGMANDETELENIRCAIDRYITMYGLRERLDNAGFLDVAGKDIYDLRLVLERSYRLLIATRNVAELRSRAENHLFTIIYNDIREMVKDHILEISTDCPERKLKELTQKLADSNRENAKLQQRLAAIGKVIGPVESLT